MALAPLYSACLFASIEMEAKATKGFLSQLYYSIKYFCPKAKNSPADNNHIFSKCSSYGQRKHQKNNNNEDMNE